MRNMQLKNPSVYEIKEQLSVARRALHPKATIYTGFKEMRRLIEMFFNYLEGRMDKKMHQVTKRMKTAEKDVKMGKKKAAVKVLKKAEKKNEKLVKIDRTVRDPLIKKAKKIVAKSKKPMPKPKAKVKGKK